MSLSRGRYGVEWNPSQDRRRSSGLGWVVSVIIALALISLSVTLYRRFTAPPPADGRGRSPVSADGRGRSPVSAEAKPSSRSESLEQCAPAPPDPLPPPPPEEFGTVNPNRRPAKVRTLLMRLQEAEKARDVEMAISTLEKLRDLPGSPAADLDDALARRLSVLNMRRLFIIKSAQWVKTVAVRRGDSASRIAAENGSTLACLAKLNGASLEKVTAGSKLLVMNHPRFNLVIRRRTRTADLSLNGKFFKRYDIQGQVKGDSGQYELHNREKNFWSSLGIALRAEDRAELEMLLPLGTSILISEM